MPTSTIRKRVNVIYITLWLLAAGLYLLNLAEEAHHHETTISIGFALKKLIIAMAPFGILFIINNFILMPRFLLRERIRWYVATTLLLQCLFGATNYIIFKNKFPDGPHPGPKCMKPPHDSPLENKDFNDIRRPMHPGGFPMPFVNDMAYCILVIGANIAITLTARQVAFNLERESLTKANAESQLEHLRAQINPHFYMNMLNNIHGLIESDPTKAQETVVEMSRLMRYMLYETSRRRISLAHETEFLRDYIELMRQRYPENRVTITADFPSEIDAAGIEVPPLLFLAFIENAFKHGVSYRRNSFIAVRIEISGKELHFTCINSLHPSEDSMHIDGIGLTNIRRRLELIYGDSATLDIKEGDSTYTVNLTIIDP